MSTAFFVTLDGQVHDAAEPFFHVDDLTVLRGDGVFETALVRGGRVLKFERHVARLADSARRLGLPEVQPRRWADAAAAAVAAWGAQDEGMLRLVLTRGRESVAPDEREPTALLYLSPVPEATLRRRAEGVAAITLERGITADVGERAPWLLLGAKTLSYAMNMAALRHAGAQGAQDVIFLDTAGRVLEGPTATVVTTSGTTLRTPPPENGILDGTTMRALYRHAAQHGYDCRIEPLVGEDLLTADGLWLVSSVALGTRVHTLDGTALPRPDGAVDLRPLIDAALA